MSDTTIELQAPKPKRVYKKSRKDAATSAKSVPVPEPVNEPVTVPEPIMELPLVETESAPKVKRVYKRKSPVVETVPPVDIPVEIPIEAPLELPTMPDVTPQKKPRTEKQIQAFNKMREARIKKQQELEDLKAFQKEQLLLEKEQAKLDKVEDQIIKKKAARSPAGSLLGDRKPRVKKPESDHEQVPQVNNLSTHKVLLFV